MFYAYPYLASHSATNLNQYIGEFFDNLKVVDKRSAFSLTTTLFPQPLLDRLSRSNELKTLFEHFFNSFKVLGPLERDAVIAQFSLTQEVEIWLSDVTRQEHRINNDNLPVPLREPAKNLFLYLYDKTIKKDLISHYGELYKQLGSEYCPFCGIEKLPKPDVRKADYDHWLKKATYPFVAVNMHNLVPIGDDCNRDFKRTQNILLDKGGHRRQFYFPYKQFFEIRLDLNGSKLPTANKRTAKWVINFTIDNNLIQDWAEVFRIKKRYADELNGEFSHWTEIFTKEYKGRVTDVNSLKKGLARHATTFEKHLYRQSNLIRHGLFNFLAECDDYTYYNSVLRDM